MHLGRCLNLFREQSGMSINCRIISESGGRCSGPLHYRLRCRFLSFPVQFYSQSAVWISTSAYKTMTLSPIKIKEKYRRYNPSRHRQCRFSRRRSSSPYPPWFLLKYRRPQMQYPTLFSILTHFQQVRSAIILI